MTTRRFEPTVQLDSGLVIPTGAAVGLSLMSDASGDAQWANDNNDALQGGFVGAVNNGVITAAMGSGGTAGQIVFTNWPTGDGVRFPTSSGPLVRGICPSTPTGGTALTPSGVTPGDYAYIAVGISHPTIPGGTASPYVAYGPSRTTAALAAADQQGAAATTLNGLLVWDGIVKNTSGTYTLVAGTPASGSIVPASTGRDRRPWAGGAFSRIFNSGSNTSTNTVSYSVMDSTKLALRVECSGVLVRVRYLTTVAFSAVAAGVLQTVIFFDGVPCNTIIGTAVPAVAENALYLLDEVVAPSAGSHLFEPGWLISGGATVTNVANSYGDNFTVEELLHGNVSNGTA